MKKELKVKDLVRKIDEVVGLIFVAFGNESIVADYFDFSSLDRKTAYAVVGILNAYRNELIENKRKYEKSPEKKEEALLKIKTVESFVLEYRDFDKEYKYRLFFKTMDAEKDAKVVCDRFEQIYAKQIEDYRARKQKSAEQAEIAQTERKKLIEENLKNL